MKLITKKIVFARDIGIHGNLFGGTLMAWIDEAAAAFATEYCYTPNMVTVRVGELLFKKTAQSRTPYPDLWRSHGTRNNFHNAGIGSKKIQLV
jgi:hypothetical protein